MPPPPKIPDRFDVLLEKYKEILHQMRRNHEIANCPLTAEAVWNYLSTGSAHPPRASLGSKVVLCSPAQSMSLESLEKLLLKAKHGAHGVLTVNPGVENQEHNVNMVNIHGTIYLVDAFNKEPVMAKNWRDYLQYGKTFEFSWEWRVFVVPDDQLSGFRCPVPATTPPNKAPNSKHGNAKQPAKQ
jgi:hypothetical protein